MFTFSSLDLPIIVAPLGASAVLVFAVPSSPLAQPWSIVGGNVLSALIGASQATDDAALKTEAATMSKAMLADGSVDASNKPAAQALSGVKAG